MVRLEVCLGEAEVVVVHRAIVVQGQEEKYEYIHGRR
jgi:hypothetical protein